MMLRIAWLSNAPFSLGGYGVETARVVKRLHDAGHHVDVIANFGLHDTMIEWNGINVYPGDSFDQTQVNRMEDYVKELNSDIVITLWDVHAFNKDWGMIPGVRWVPWLPIDRHPVPKSISEPLKGAFWILPWCEDAKNGLEKAGFTNQTIVPLSVETGIFRPLVGETSTRTGLPMTKSDFKAGMGVDDDTFVIGMVGINQDYRKNIYRVINAVGMLKKDIPNMRLVLHSPLFRPGGIHLPTFVERAGIEDITHYTPQHKYFRGLSLYEMASLYNQLDVLMLPSAGEGFGLPIVEANACGIPAIFTNYTAMPEVGYGIGIDPVAKEIYDKDAPNDPCYRAIVRDEQIAEAIHAMYKIWAEDKEKWKQIGIEARESAMRFDADHVVQTYWLPTLKMIEDKLLEDRAWVTQLV